MIGAVAETERTSYVPTGAAFRSGASISEGLDPLVDALKRAVERRQVRPDRQPVAVETAKR